MGQMDICEKHFTEHNDIFADLVNMAYFAGIEFIKPESLTDRPARQLIMREDELGELEPSPDLRRPICGRWPVI